MGSFQIWISSYWTQVAPGQFGWVPVTKLTELKATSFEEACFDYVVAMDTLEFLDTKTLIYGPTKLFPSEQEARIFKDERYADVG